MPCICVATGKQRFAPRAAKLLARKGEVIMNRHFQAVRRVFTMTLGVLILGVMATGTARAAGCDRACLQNMITEYLDAMVAHAPSRLPLAANVRFTEDSHELKLGDGLWKTVTRQGEFRQDYIDVKGQIAASQVVLFEGNTQVLYSVVLHVAKGEISGIETLEFRVPADAKPSSDHTNKPLPECPLCILPDHLDKPLQGMNEPVPAGKGIPRAEMVRVAMAYVEGLRVGSFVQANTPFAPDAYRLENGFMTAGEGCMSPNSSCDPRTQKIRTHPDIKASIAAVDEEAGIVLLWMNFGDTHTYGPGNALILFEAFKVWDGNIHGINAFMFYLPKETQRGWPSVE